MIAEEYLVALGVVLGGLYLLYELYTFIQPLM
jgi:hypothetical protein